VRWLGLESGYPLVPLAAFTPYVALIAVPAAVGLAMLRQRAAAALAALAAVALLAAVLPRALAETTGGGPALRVLTANMRLGEADARALSELVRSERVDVLAVQELTPPLVARLREAGLESQLPHSLLAPAPQSAGGGIWTRRPHRPVGAAPSSLAEALPAVRLRGPGDAQAIVYDVHPPPPTGAAATREWEADLASIPSAGSGPLRIVAGDFNATLDHDAFRDVVDRGYADAGDRAGVGLQPTWPNGRLFPPQVTIDHVLVDERAGIGGADVFELPGSDHRAVLAEVLPPPGESP
jgi:endonuclease/exonuclease/phosphatase (EEP) superfamily protein YafD